MRLKHRTQLGGHMKESPRSAKGMQANGYRPNVFDQTCMQMNQEKPGCPRSVVAEPANASTSHANGDRGRRDARGDRLPPTHTSAKGDPWEVSTHSHQLAGMAALVSSVTTRQLKAVRDAKAAKEQTEAATLSIPANTYAADWCASHPSTIWQMPNSFGTDGKPLHGTCDGGGEPHYGQ